jgi:tetratricopeptide (TPR) repeat protein
MMTVTFPSSIASQRVWNALKRADCLLFSGMVGEALDVYRDVQREVVAFLTTPQSLWAATSVESEDQPSLSTVCCLIGEFYGLEHRWQTWLILAAPLFKDSVWRTLPFPVRARLTVLRGWATFKRKGFTLNGITRQQWHCLREWRQREQTDLFTIAGHHLVLCYAYTLAFRFKKAREHGQEALKLFEQTGSPYYCFKALDVLGALEYTAGQYDAATNWHQRADDLSRATIQGGMLTTDFTHGWVLIGQKRFDEAVTRFQRAYALKEYQGIYYDAARCIYAEAYARFRLNDDPAYSAASSCLQRAKRFFFEELRPDADADGIQTAALAYPMKAACLHVEGLILEYQKQFCAALRKFEAAIAFQREVNDPGQMSDMLRRAIYNAWRCRRLDRMVVHGVMFLLLLLRFRVPVF